MCMWKMCVMGGHTCCFMSSVRGRRGVWEGGEGGSSRGGAWGGGEVWGGGIEGSCVY